ncbi:ABC transporter permease [Agromyces silvae]|uniref:ABC transporter permease n=1 Tax=Agromyces silvae TaxID=3388266 RepID=UPI00280AB4E6|nr:ABC transporter permease subunit [Agromyces protaetiae]
MIRSGLSLAGATPRRELPRKLGYGALAVCALLLLWAVTSAWMAQPLLYPGPWETLVGLVGELGTLDYWAAIGLSVGRIILGFAIGSLLGVVVGILIGSSRLVRTALEPYVHFFRSIIAIAWIAPAAIWFGVGSPSVIFLVIYATMFMVVVNTVQGMSEVDEQRLRMARAAGASRLRTVLSIEIPSSVPHILSGMRVGMSNAFGTAIGAEMLVGIVGIGYTVYEARFLFEGAVMFGSIVVIGILGFLFNYVLSLLAQLGLRRFA